MINPINPVGLYPIDLYNIHMARAIASMGGFKISPYAEQTQQGNISKITLYRKGLRVNFVNIAYDGSGRIYDNTQIPKFDFTISQILDTGAKPTLDITISGFSRTPPLINQTWQA